MCLVRRSHGCRADTLTVVSEAMIDRSMVMAKTGWRSGWTCLVPPPGSMETVSSSAGSGGLFRGAIQTTYPLPSPPPPPPASHTSSSPPSTSATDWTDAGRLLIWRQPQCTLYTVHCTVLCVHCTAPPPPLVPLLGHGGDLQPAAFIHRYTTRARPGTAHLYRLALCLKQGFW